MKNFISFQLFIASNKNSCVTNPFQDSSGSWEVECMEILVSSTCYSTTPVLKTVNSIALSEPGAI